MPRQVPSYRYHKARNQACVDFDRRRYYLGKYGSLESKRRYNKLLKEWLERNKDDVALAPVVRPAPEAVPEVPTTEADTSDDITVVEVIADYMAHCVDYYGPPSQRRSETYNLRPVMRTLREMYGDTPVKDFGPLKLKAVRQQLVDVGQCRATVNKNVRRIRRMFEWAVGEELIHVDVHTRLKAVRGLAKGRTTARESREVLPVPEADLLATLPHLPPVVRDMVEVQWMTGMRAGEIIRIRPAEINRSAEVWLWKPTHHKTAWKEKQRIVVIGPRAQAILSRYLFREYCFVTEAGKRYEAGSYNQAIRRACNRANVTRWTPGQLRHNRATEIHEQFGIEGAQATLGHSSAQVTLVYAERALRKAMDIARQTG